MLASISKSADYAFSLRQINDDYHGPIVQVREDGGDTDRDIYPMPDGSLDIGALLAHCGTNSGYINTWYDQSGTGADAASVSDATQPRLVDAGVLETLPGGKTGIPCARWLDASDTLRVNPAPTGLDISLSIVYHFGTDPNYIIIDDAATTSRYGPAAQSGSATSYDSTWGNVSVAYKNGLPSGANTRDNIHDDFTDQVALALYVDGSQVSFSSNLDIGAYPAGFDFSGDGGYLAEIISFDGNLGAADITRLHESQHGYFVAPDRVPVPVGVLFTAVAAGPTLPVFDHHYRMMRAV